MAKATSVFTRFIDFLGIGIGGRRPSSVSLLRSGAASQRVRPAPSTNSSTRRAMQPDLCGERIPGFRVAEKFDSAQQI